jgi:casein kinase I family protein HRR25
MSNINNYEIDYSELLGQGSYGKIYKAWHVIKKKWYAVKIEAKCNKSLLAHEHNIISKIMGVENCIECYDYFSDEENNYCIITLLGVSLARIMKKIKIMSIDDVITLAPLLIDQLEKIHSVGIIHRDIKPANFMYTCDFSQIILIDFGLAIECKSVGTDYKSAGTINYMSINALKKGPPTFRDDLQSLGYVLLQLAYGSLFWAHIKYESKETRNKKMLKLRENLSNADLVRQFKCKNVHNHCPYQTAMLNYLNHCMTEPINYNYLKGLFIDINH